MFGFIKKIFGAKPVEAEAPYKVEVVAVSESPATVVVEGAGEVTAEATPAKAKPAKAKKAKPAKPAAIKAKKPRKPKAPKA